MTQVLVTGGAGYLGSVLVPFLLEKGYEVVVLDNFMYNQASLLDCCYNKKLTIIRGDARDEKLVKGLIRGADVILPLACLTGAPLCDKDPIGARSVNLDAVKLILKLKAKSQQIIFPTTNSGYGIGRKGVFCNEKTPLKPISLYGQLKVEAEMQVLHSGNSITLRLATVFGASPRMRIDLLVNDFVYRAVTDRAVVLFEGHFKRNYIHIRDVARAFVFCLEHFDQMKGEAYNIGLSDCNISKVELCQAIKKQVPGFYYTEAQIGNDPDKRDYVVSNEKIEKAGFKPFFSLHDGISELIKTFQVLKKTQYGNL